MNFSFSCYFRDLGKRCVLEINVSECVGKGGNNFNCPNSLSVMMIEKDDDGIVDDEEEFRSTGLKQIKKIATLSNESR